MYSASLCVMPSRDGTKIIAAGQIEWMRPLALFMAGTSLLAFLLARLLPPLCLEVLEEGGIVIGCGGLARCA